MFHTFVWQRKALCLTLVSCCALYAAWVPFGSNTPQTPQIDILSSTNTSVLLTITISGADAQDIDTRLITDSGTEVFSLLSLGEYAHTHEIGKPKLPVVTTVLDVPHNAQIEVTIVDAEFSEVSLQTLGLTNRIIPALESVSKSSQAPAHFVLNEATYTDDAYYPGYVYDIEEFDGFARGHRLATLRSFPIQYNPVTGMLRVYTHLTVEVRFAHGDIQATKQIIAQDYSHVWEEYIQSMVVNYPEYLRGVPPLPIYYDIFYHGAFSEAAESLAHWKQKKGYKVRMWNAAGWSAAQINDSIEAQVPLATFLVIMGDPNSSTHLPPSQNGLSTYDQTDLYYAETDGSGYLPDMYNARIAVLNATQANTVVEKAIRYEHADFGSAGYEWLKKACLIAGYDSYWQYVGVGTNAYCRNLLLANHYDVDTLITYYGEEEGRVVAQINAGRAWCVYTAHGGRTEWWVGYSTGFNVSELTNLTNNLDMYPMPCGHCCLAADFQYSVSCFGETWDRLSGKGGICYFGSVPSTMWTEDDWLQRRYFDAIYADSIPGNLYETGRFTQWALYWINNNTGTSSKRYYFEAYHIFNDPALDFWTEIPATMGVTYNSSVAPGSQSFTVTVVDSAGGPLEDALVCCWVPEQNPEMHVSQYTDASGTAVLSIAPQAQGGTMYVTVTRHSYIPHEGYVTIGADAPAAPHITLAEKSGSNVNLTWHLVTTDQFGNPVDTDHYVVYRGISPFYAPNGSDSIGTASHPDTTFIDYGVLSDLQSYYYIVKAVDDTGNHSEQSNMAYAFHKFFNENANATDKNWVALPCITDYATVADLVADLSPAGDPLTVITRLDDTLQQYESYIWLGSLWSGSNFAIEPGRAYEMVTTADTSLVFVGTNDPDGLISLNENPAKTDRNWVAMPYNAVYSTVSDITTEYAPAGNPLTIITRLDETFQQYESYLWLGHMWAGPDFAIVPGTGYEFVTVVDTFWNPTEHDNAKSNKPTPLTAGHKHSKPDILMLGTLAETDRIPVWMQQGTRYMHAPETAAATYREVGVSHIVRLHCATDGLRNFIFTVYRPDQPYDVLTEKTIGSGIVGDNAVTALWFDVGNFKNPWQHGEEVLIIVEASGTKENYYTIQTITIDGQKNLEDIRGEIKLSPLPAVNFARGINQWRAVDNEDVIGYSVYSRKERLNNDVLTSTSFEAPEGVSVRLVLRGGHESVRSQGSQSYLDELPQVSALSFSPNPFMQETQIQYQISHAGAVDLKVYDTSGRLVRTLVHEVSDPGYYRLIWDGKDNTGRVLSAGVYFITFAVDVQGTPLYSTVKKAVLIAQ